MRNAKVFGTADMPAVVAGMLLDPNEELAFYEVGSLSRCFGGLLTWENSQQRARLTDDWLLEHGAESGETVVIQRGEATIGTPADNPTQPA